MGVAITTNHHVHEFLYQWDVPNDVLNDQFEHLDSFEATTGFFKYRGWWYHVSDFMGTPMEGVGRGCPGFFLLRCTDKAT